jgi:hypothetical protein
VPPSKIDDAHHIGRHVSSGRLKRDENDRVYGVFPQAFRMRPDENELSGSWVEFFDGSWQERVQRTLQAIRSVGLTIRPRDGIAISNVGSIHEACSVFDIRVRVLHESSKKNPNPAYAAVRGLPRDNDELFGLLAAACLEPRTVAELDKAASTGG